MAAKDAAGSVLFHFSVRLWTAFAAHENKSSADVDLQAGSFLVWLRDGLCRPHRRAKCYTHYELLTMY